MKITSLPLSLFKAIRGNCMLKRLRNGLQQTMHWMQNLLNEQCPCQEQIILGLFLLPILLKYLIKLSPFIPHCSSFISYITKPKPQNQNTGWIKQVSSIAPLTGNFIVCSHKCSQNINKLGINSTHYIPAFAWQGAQVFEANS